MVRVFHITKNNASLYQRHITFLRISMLALTHPLTHSSVAPLLLFLPPQSDVADMLAVSRRTIHIVFVFVFVFGAYHSNHLAAQLDAPAEVRFVTTSTISRWCQTFATGVHFSRNQCVLSHILHRNFKYTYSFCNFKHMWREVFPKLYSYLREALRKIVKI